MHCTFNDLNKLNSVPNYSHYSQQVNTSIIKGGELVFKT